MVEEVDDGNAFSGTWSAGFAGVAAVKFPHKSTCGDIRERFPGVVTSCLSGSLVSCFI
jgi:hypothetical protein